jgi:hypothetical protein
VTGKLAHQCKQKGGIDTYHKVLLTSAIVCFIEITMSHVSVKIDLMLCLGATSLIITNNDIEAYGNNVAWLYLKRVVNASVHLCCGHFPPGALVGPRMPQSSLPHLFLYPSLGSLLLLLCNMPQGPQGGSGTPQTLLPMPSNPFPSSPSEANYAGSGHCKTGVVPVCHSYVPLPLQDFPSISAWWY